MAASLVVNEMNVKQTKEQTRLFFRGYISYLIAVCVPSFVIALKIILGYVVSNARLALLVHIQRLVELSPVGFILTCKLEHVISYVAGVMFRAHIIGVQTQRDVAVHFRFDVIVQVAAILKLRF